MKKPPPIIGMPANFIGEPPKFVQQGISHNAQPSLAELTLAVPVPSLHWHSSIRCPLLKPLAEITQPGQRVFPDGYLPKPTGTLTWSMIRLSRSEMSMTFSGKGYTCVTGLHGALRFVAVCGPFTPVGGRPGVNGIDGPPHVGLEGAGVSTSEHAAYTSSIHDPHLTDLILK